MSDDDVCCDRAATEDLISKANAGMRLFFALYHHPDAVKVVGAAMESRGFTNAYIQAQDAFLSQGRRGKGEIKHGSEGTGTEADEAQGAARGPQGPNES